MARLTPEELRSRLALDYRAMRTLRGVALGPVEAFVSPLDLALGREADDAKGLRGVVTVYRVEFRFPMLRSPGSLLHRARAVFEVPSHGYPFESPRVCFETDAIPFSPHIRQDVGIVCLGGAWPEARGNWLLANLVVHVMKLANFDEPCTRDGFSYEAVRYAREVLRGRPLNPDLDYPVLDERVTHSGAGPEPEPEPEPPVALFRRSSGFAPRPSFGAPEELSFRRRPL